MGGPPISQSIRTPDKARLLLDVDRDLKWLDRGLTIVGPGQKENPNTYVNCQ